MVPEMIPARFFISTPSLFVIGSRCKGYGDSHSTILSRENPDFYVIFLDLIPELIEVIFEYYEKINYI